MKEQDAFAVPDPKARLQDVRSETIHAVNEARTYAIGEECGAVRSYLVHIPTRISEKWSCISEWCQRGEQSRGGTFDEMAARERAITGGGARIGSCLVQDA